MYLEVLIFFILFLIIYMYWNRDPPDYPPGPFKIPIIGGGVPPNDDRCIKLQKKYGDLIMEKIGNFNWLTMCDYKLCKEAFSKPEVADRPEFQTFKDLQGGELSGLAATNGEHWKSNRRFILHYLKDSGMGKSFLEDSIQREAKEIVAEFNRLNGSTTTLTFLNFAPLNIIWKMVASKRYDVNDPQLDRLQRLNQEFSKSMGRMLLLDFVPVLNRILPRRVANYIFDRSRILEFFAALKNIAQPIIEEHKEHLDRNNPKDLIDMYSIEAEDPVHLIPEYISDRDLAALTIDLFNAGSDTVSVTLRWAIFYLTKYPHIQIKMQEEIDRVVPRDMLPGYQHKTQLPYCEAVIHETLRKSSLANFGGIHMNSEEIHLGGYRIPKGTVITSANFFIHHDPRYWENPDEFNPDRFINADGKFCCPKEGFLAFSIGRRQCPGEGLARSEIYIFLTAIFHHFSFSSPEGKDVTLTYSNKNIGMHLPEDQEVLVHARNSNDDNNRSD